MNKKWAYYNEIDKNAAEWIRQLMKLGQFAPGTVDERSIRDVNPADLRSFSQIHFFAVVAPLAQVFIESLMEII
jgi:DNA (cytosine-5)-methyltransferase 1